MGEVLSEELEILVDDLRDRLHKLLKILLKKGVIDEADYFEITGD